MEGNLDSEVTHLEQFNDVSSEDYIAQPKVLAAALVASLSAVLSKSFSSRQGKSGKG